MANKALAKKQAEVEGEQKLTFVDIALAIDNLNMAIEDCEDQAQRVVLMDELNQMMVTHAPHKLDGVGYYLKDQEKSIEALKLIKQAVDRKIKRHQNAIDRMYDLLHYVLVKIGLPKLEGKFTTVSLCAGRTGGPEVYDRAKLPAEYFMIIPAQVIPDLEKIETDLKAKKEVPGARLKQGKDYIQVR